MLTISTTSSFDKKFLYISPEGVLSSSEKKSSLEAVTRRLNQSNLIHLQLESGENGSNFLSLVTTVNQTIDRHHAKWKQTLFGRIWLSISIFFGFAAQKINLKACERAVRVNRMVRQIDDSNSEIKPTGNLRRQQLFLLNLFLQRAMKTTKPMYELKLITNGALREYKQAGRYSNEEWQIMEAWLKKIPEECCRKIESGFVPTNI